MYEFGDRSLKNLNEADSKLQALFLEVIKHYDCAVIEGYRPKDEQNKAYHAGKSTLKYPQSKHNSRPSMAVDIVPWPIDWGDYNRFYYFGGLVKGIAAKMGVSIRWGGDWDSDNSFKDQSFNDLPHFELVD